MVDPKDVKAHTDKIEAMFGRAALLAADAKTLRDRAKDDAAKAEAYEGQALKLREAARVLVARGPDCSCGGTKTAPAAPVVVEGPPTQTVDSSAAVVAHD